MAAIRLARGYTNRSRIVKFEGCYHGHGDAFLVKAGSGALTLGLPNSPGVPAALADLTLTLPYNDFDAAEQLFAQQGADIACLIVEPIVGNANLILPRRGYLDHLRELCTRHGALLIFDEVMTGFRVAPGGAQDLYGIRPDLSTFGKIIGGGMPGGAYGGRADIMRMVAPSGPVYQAGTLSGNPIFGAKRLVHSLKGACGAKGEKSLSVLASWREKHGSSSAPPLIVGLSILVILVHLVVPSSFRPINAQRRWAVS